MATRLVSSAPKPTAPPAPSCRKPATSPKDAWDYIRVQLVPVETQDPEDPVES
jgi:hypothetical protein